MTPLSAPVKVSLDVTSRCNLACRHCRTEPAGPASRTLRAEDLLEIVTDLATLGVFRLGLSGGEPLLLAALPDLVRHALRRGVPRVIVSTNATLVSDVGVRPFRELRDRLTFKVSVDGPTKVHDGMRGTPGALAAGVEGIRRLVAGGFDTQVTTTLTRETLSHLPETLDLVRELGCSRHFVVEVVPVGRAAPSMLLTAEERREAAGAVRRFAGNGGGAGGRVVTKIAFAEDATFGFECSAGISECGVLADGRIVGCRLLPGIHEGFVQERPVSRVWRSPEGFSFFRRERRRRLGEPCRGCARLAACGGGCAACADPPPGEGDREGPDPRCPQARVPG